MITTKIVRILIVTVLLAGFLGGVVMARETGKGFGVTLTAYFDSDFEVSDIKIDKVEIYEVLTPDISRNGNGNVFVLETLDSSKKVLSKLDINISSSDIESNYQNNGYPLGYKLAYSDKAKYIQIRKDNKVFDSYSISGKTVTIDNKAEAQESASSNTEDNITIKSIKSGDEQTVTSKDGVVNIHFPKGAFDTDVKVMLEKIERSLKYKESIYSTALSTYQIRAYTSDGKDLTQLTKPGKISFKLPSKLSQAQDKEFLLSYVSLSSDKPMFVDSNFSGDTLTATFKDLGGYAVTQKKVPTRSFIAQIFINWPYHTVAAVLLSVMSGVGVFIVYKQRRHKLNS